MPPWSSRFRAAASLLALALAAASASGARAASLLVSDEGKKIRSSAKWELLRRGEMASALGRRAGYGTFLSTELESHAAREISREELVLDGRAVLKRAKVAASTQAGPVVVDVACFIPRGGLVGAAPAFLMIGAPDWKEKLDPAISELDDEFWPVATIVSRGCAAASFAAASYSARAAAKSLEARAMSPRR